MRGFTDPADSFRVGDIGTESFRKRFPDGLYSKEMIAHYSSAMRRIAILRVSDLEAAKELVQDCWLTFSENQKAGKHHKSVQIRAILVNLTKCQAAKFHRKWKAEKASLLRTPEPIDLDSLPGKVQDPETLADHRLRMERVIAFVQESSRLNPLERYILIRTCQGGRTGEIADELQMPSKAVSKMKYRATRTVRDLLHNRDTNAEG